jgi:hypothetical protein
MLKCHNIATFRSAEMIPSFNLAQPGFKILASENKYIDIQTELEQMKNNCREHGNTSFIYLTKSK